mmetsp:Transcript_129242/g.359912  ORF Transcript_129242/g.359912 Transcript_129242/m.359912 type:complete len:209 (+) Transcript_129242:457-1083(+)
MASSLISRQRSASGESSAAKSALAMPAASCTAWRLFMRQRSSAALSMVKPVSKLSRQSYTGSVTVVASSTHPLGVEHREGARPPPGLVLGSLWLLLCPLHRPEWRKGKWLELYAGAVSSSRMRGCCESTERTRMPSLCPMIAMARSAQGLPPWHPGRRLHVLYLKPPNSSLLLHWHGGKKWWYPSSFSASIRGRTSALLSRTRRSSAP